MRATNLNKKGENYYYFKASQYQWKDADPTSEDVKYFLTEKEAIEYIGALDIQVGFSARIEKISIECAELENKIEDEDFDLNEIGEIDGLYSLDFETIFEGEENRGDNLEGAIIVIWSYEKYVGYARNFLGIRYGISKENESDLVDNSNRTFLPTESILLSREEIEGLSDSDILESVFEKLNEKRWRWSYFKNYPTKEKIITGIGLCV